MSLSTSARPTRRPNAFWGMVSDDELDRLDLFYRRRLVLLPEEIGDPRPELTAQELERFRPGIREAIVTKGAHRACSLEELRQETAAYLRMQIEDIQAELRSRRLAATRGLPVRRTHYDRAFLVALRSRIPLDQLVETELGTHLGPLTPSGTRSGPCPIHRGGETSRAFVVYVDDRDDQHFFCFRCGARGDAISVLQLAHRLEFAGAVHRLAAMAGMVLPGSRGGERRAAS